MFGQVRDRYISHSLPPPIKSVRVKRVSVERGQWLSLRQSLAINKICVSQQSLVQRDRNHKTLSALQKYLEVLDEDLDKAIATLVF